MFIPGSSLPLRFDFFGDELESIQQFQIDTLAPCGRVKRVSIFRFAMLVSVPNQLSAWRLWLRHYGERLPYLRVAVFTRISKMRARAGTLPVVMLYGRS